MARAVRIAVRCLGVAVSAAVVGCGSSGGNQPPSSCFAGDPAASPAVTLVYQTAGGGLAPVIEGSSLPLTVPPQGGEALIVGVRALNLDGCPLLQSTSIALPSSGVVAAFERRPVTLAPAADGWLEPTNPAGLANFANLPACPIAGLSQAIDGEPYTLTVAVEDQASRQAQASATIVPTCDAAPNPAVCQCLCAAGYVLGSPCP